MIFEELTGTVIDAACRVHSAVGAGLFEEVYKACMQYELEKRGLKVLPEVAFPAFYDGVELDIGYRVDLMVEDTLIVELKSVERLAALHKAQLLTYLKLSNLPVGLLLNFNVPHLRKGIVRIINMPPCPQRPPC